MTDDTTISQTPAKDRPKSPKLVIIDAIHQLTQSRRTISREVLMRFTGLKYSIVDDHLKTLREEGLIFTPVKGVIELVPEQPATRTIKTEFPDNGSVRVCVGELCLELTLMEGMLLGQALAGIGLRFGR